MTEAAPDSHLLRRIEITTAVLLSLAGLLSAWASYQASLWGGIQADRYAKANVKVTEAARLSIIDGQLVDTDSTLFMGWLEAAAAGDEDRMAFFERRFSPELHAKFDPWRARFPGDLRRLTPDPDAPNRFPRPEHAEGAQAAALQAAAAAEFVEGDIANRTGDRYVATTVLFSTVLFLGGISPLLQNPRIRIGMLILAALLGVAAIVLMARLPMAAP